MSVEQILAIFRETEATPHQVVLKHDDTEVVLASGSVVNNEYPWGVETVRAENDGDFVLEKNGPNISWVFERFGKLRRNGAVGLANGSVVSCEPIKK